MHNETVEHDANRYVDLLRAAVPAGVLSPAATPRSSRLHEILPADGYTTELRLALTTPGRYWGALSLFRRRPSPVRRRRRRSGPRLAPTLAQVVRRYQVGRPSPEVPHARTPAALSASTPATASSAPTDARARRPGVVYQRVDRRRGRPRT